jgi:restriction system protein
MKTLIDVNPPARWRDLEDHVAQILEECGYEVTPQKALPMARGTVDADVYAVEHTSPPNVFVVECKNWKTAVSKSIIHAFRTVVADSGANTGLLISAAGFQKGAIEAAKYTNIRLVTWEEFQVLFVERWYQQHMVPRLHEEAEPLREYTESLNSRIFKKADQLTSVQRKWFRTLREKHRMLGYTTYLIFGLPGVANGATIPELPLRVATPSKFPGELPDDVLDASALRPLMTALTDRYRAAIAEFDELFGERA